MEKVYRKLPNGRYEEIGYNGIPDLSNGIWLVENRPHSKSKASLIWRVGDLKRPVDVATKAAFYSIMDDIAHYIVKLSDPKSVEYFEAVEQLGDWDQSGNRGYGFYNISAYDYTMLILNKISSYFEETEAPPSFWEVLRPHINEHYADRQIILDVISYLEKSGFYLKKLNK